MRADSLLNYRSHSSVLAHAHLRKNETRVLIILPSCAVTIGHSLLNIHVDDVTKKKTVFRRRLLSGVKRNCQMGRKAGNFLQISMKLPIRTNIMNIIDVAQNMNQNVRTTCFDIKKVYILTTECM
jgi:hypothetical protein